MIYEKAPIFLVVEDDPLDFKLLKKAVDLADCRIPMIHFETGPELIEYLNNFSEEEHRIAAIFLDLKMPVMSGLEVLEILRAKEQTMYIPVIMISASTFDKDVETAYVLGANAYMGKPMDRKAFNDQVMHLVQFWGEVNQSYPG